ncbi:hypothetical protein B9Z55_000061 [Caenorhabditis nigoni]|uniref:Uncharacterized protein n=1 Tax=Caenorhabditis nigoni TaxID=1611254 RepID=A0A2G5VUM7_9PELO|nr:hypothetical protein B9Z55_000061 [Caenorhabditis nigoni]
MLSILLFICLAAISHAGIYSRNSSFIDAELNKISTDCFSNKDYEHLFDDLLKRNVARTAGANLPQACMNEIGLEELRRALKFAPPRPWKPYNSTKPNKEELAAASSIEAYYDLIEPISLLLTLDNDFYFKKNVDTGVVYLDKRLPSIRNIFRFRFEEMLQEKKGVIDRKLVDSMKKELIEIYRKVNDAIDDMKWSYKCWD